MTRHLPLNSMHRCTFHLDQLPEVQNRTGVKFQLFEVPDYLSLLGHTRASPATGQENRRNSNARLRGKHVLHARDFGMKEMKKYGMQ